MLWGSSTQKNNKTSEPPTPGLASWAFNSLFTNRTPLSKYNDLNRDQEHEDMGRNDENFSDVTDTFQHRRKSILKKSTMGDNNNHNRREVLENRSMENELNTNIASNKTRSQTSYLCNQNITPNTRKFHEENELLYDDDEDEDEYKRTYRFSDRKTKKSPMLFGNSDNDTKTSLPSYYPGKFPNVSSKNERYEKKDEGYANDSDLIRQAEINREANLHNTRPRKVLNDFEEIKRPSKLVREESYNKPLSTSGLQTKNISESEKKEILRSLDSNNSQLEVIQRKLQDLNLVEEYSSLQTNYNQLVEENIALKDQLNQQTKLQTVATGHLESLSEKYLTLKEDHRKTMEKLTLLSEKYVSLKAKSTDHTEIDELTRKYDEKVTRIEKQNGILEDKCSNLNRDIRIKDGKLEECLKRNRDLEDEVRSLQRFRKEMNQKQEDELQLLREQLEQERDRSRRTKRYEDEESYDSYNQLNLPSRPQSGTSKLNEQLEGESPFFTKESFQNQQRRRTQFLSETPLKRHTKSQTLQKGYLEEDEDDYVAAVDDTNMLLNFNSKDFLEKKSRKLHVQEDVFGNETVDLLKGFRPLSSRG